MGYAWEDLDDAQFERVVVELVRIQFGVGIQSFASGKDGGRDARFEGTAQQFPSTTGPWTGVTVFQAKHTSAINTHYSDSEFSGDSDSSVLSKELPRIRALVVSGSLDNYFLVSNRRLGAITHENLKKKITAETGLEGSQIFVAGIEYLNEMLHHYPNILESARIDPLDGPLLVSSQELAEVIIAMAQEFNVTARSEESQVVDRISYKDKNRINLMSPEFADALLKNYLQETKRIEDFLANPANVEYRELYESTVEEFQLKIIATQTSERPFDKVFNYLTDLLFSRDGVLSKNRSLTRATLFYMYWHCDIGRSNDVDA